jgi:hypothetical protein
MEDKKAEREANFKRSYTRDMMPELVAALPLVCFHQCRRSAAFQEVESMRLMLWESHLTIWMIFFLLSSHKSGKEAVQ